MTPTAEVLTMTKKGLADFLMELKRTQLRNRTPFDKFVALVLKTKPKNASKRKAFLASPTLQRERYALYIDDAVAAWEQQQQTAVAEAAVPKPLPAESEDADIHNMFAGKIAALDSKLLASAYNSIRFYLGDLNRDVNAGRVAAYGTDMERGNWWFSPDPVVVTDEGNIINGQHRLLAVEGALADELTDANAPSFVVVWGVDKRAAILMDEARRTASDRRDIALRFARSG